MRYLEGYGTYTLKYKILNNPSYRDTWHKLLYCTFASHFYSYTFFS
jgi:hypothetical protein